MQPSGKHFTTIERKRKRRRRRRKKKKEERRGYFSRGRIEKKKGKLSGDTLWLW